MCTELGTTRRERQNLHRDTSQGNVCLQCSHRRVTFSRQPRQAHSPNSIEREHIGHSLYSGNFVTMSIITPTPCTNFGSSPRLTPPIPWLLIVSRAGNFLVKFKFKLACTAGQTSPRQTSPRPDQPLSCPKHAHSHQQTEFPYMRQISASVHKPKTGSHPWHHHDEPSLEPSSCKKRSDWYALEH
jgi:hypothetical protein